MSLSFERFRREHSRLHDPEVLQSSYELVPVAPAQAEEAPARKKKKGKRKGARGASQPRATMHTDADAVEVAPKVYVSPSVLTCQVQVFNDQSFEFHSPACRRAEMLWVRAEADADTRRTEAQRVVMDHQRGGLFAATVGIEDGEYLLAFSADGCVRPDPRGATRVVLRRDGLFSPMSLERNTRALKVENRGAHEKEIYLEADAEWVETSAVVVSRRETAEIELCIRPELLTPGRYQTMLTPAPLVTYETEQTNEPEQTDETEQTDAAESVEGVRLLVSAEAGGAIPSFRISPSELGAIAQGRGHVEISVRVGARGKGQLKGMVMLSNLDEVVDFRLDASDPTLHFAHTFRIDSARLPYREEGALRLTLVTDSYLANFRQQHINVPYSLIYLKKSLPALSYGRVKKGMTRTLRLEVSRSDGEEVDLEVSMPQVAGNCLEAYRVRPNVYSFRFDTREVALGGSVSESITLTDRLSGLSDRVKVLAEVGN